MMVLDRLINPKKKYYKYHNYIGKSPDTVEISVENVLKT